MYSLLVFVEHVRLEITFSCNVRSSGSTVGSLSMTSSISDPFSKLFLGPSKAEATRQVEEANAEMLMAEIDPVDIDRIYLNSTNLSGNAFV